MFSTKLSVFSYQLSVIPESFKKEKIMIGVKPYIAFNGNCEEAINFYKNSLNAEVLYMGRYGDSPMSEPGIEDKILHATMKVGDTHIMACDNMSAEAATGSNISLAVGTSDVSQAETIFDKMADGGNVTMSMQETFWAERFGMLTDKFGINWMFNVDKPQTEEKAATS